MTHARFAVLISVVTNMLLGSSALASPIFGNTFFGGQTGAGDGGNLSLAVEFLTGATDQSLGSATFHAKLNGASLSASIHAVNAGSPATPGALLSLLTSPPMPSAIGFQSYTFTEGTPFTLLANTSYWIELDATSTTGNDVFLGVSSLPTGPGATSEGIYANPSSYNIQAVQFELDTPAAAQVDEPGTLALFSAATGAALAGRRRRQRRACRE